MVLARSLPRSSLSRLRLLRTARQTPFSQHGQRTGRRGYASASEQAQKAKETAKKGLAGDLPWAIGAVVVTVPGTYLILHNGKTELVRDYPGDKWHPPHDEEEEGEEGEEEAGAEGESEESGEKGADESSEEGEGEAKEEAEGEAKEASGEEAKEDSEGEAKGENAGEEEAKTESKDESEGESKTEEKKESAEEESKSESSEEKKDS